MSNAETLQQHNSRMEKNNVDLNDILDTVNSLPNRDINSILDVQVDGVSVVTNRVANIQLSNLENVLRDILSAIQNGGTTSSTIEEIEQLIVSYFENKTVEEVEA